MSKKIGTLKTGHLIEVGRLIQGSYIVTSLTVLTIKFKLIKLTYKIHGCYHIRKLTGDNFSKTNNSLR